MNRELDIVCVGTTSVCNASCIHCPTNKTETERILRGSMDLQLFRSIVDQLSQEGLSIRDYFGIGLFGDPLLDRFVVRRAEIIRSKLPSIFVCMSTNAAAYEPIAHAALVDYIDCLKIHIESLRPNVYDDIMRSLRLERVLPKIEAMIQTFGHKVTVGVHLNRENISDRQAIADYFLERGVFQVVFSALSNRCSQNPSFNRLALAPRDAPCRRDVLRTLVVDWDGKVLMCSNDFQKEVCVGDLSVSPLELILENPQRAAFAAKLDALDWSSIATCSKCRWDNVETEVYTRMT